MPCSSHNYGYDLSVHEGCKREIDRLTDMLCRCCLALQVSGAIFPNDINNWWGIHQAQDKLRKERELKNE